MKKDRIAYKIVYCVLLTIIVLGLVSCAPKATTEETAQVATEEPGVASTETPKTIKLGFIAPMTGNGAFWGIRGQQAVQIAVDEINAQGGINGAMVEVDYQDDRTDKTEVATIMKRFVEDPEIIAVIGSVMSGDNFIGAPIANQGGLVMCGFATTADGIPQIGEYSFRVANTAAVAIPAILTWAKEKYGLEKVAMVYSLNNDYSVAAQKIWAEEAEKLGIEMVAVETYSDGDTDFSAQVTKIVQAEPDAIILAGYAAEGSLVAIEALKQGLAVPFLGGDGINDSETLHKVGGEATNGIFLYSSFNSAYDAPKAKAFTEEFVKRYDAQPEAAAASAYDVAWMMFEALKVSGPDRAKFRDAFATIKDFEGVEGTISFDENRETIMSTFILEHQNGEFLLVKVQDAAK
jgi:branched-chain amino acid transport system substrate-binding protein